MTPSGARKISVYVMPVIIFGLLYFSAAVSAVESLVVPYESYIYDFWGRLCRHPKHTCRYG